MWIVFRESWHAKTITKKVETLSNESTFPPFLGTFTIKNLEIKNLMKTHLLKAIQTKLVTEYLTTAVCPINREAQAYKI